MGQYTEQIANLHSWSDLRSEAWQAIEQSLVDRLTPAWLRSSLEDMRAALAAERARLSALEARDRALHAQVEREASSQLDIRRDLQRAIEALRASEIRQKALQDELEVAHQEFSEKLGERDQVLRARISNEHITQNALRAQLNEAINAVTASDQKRQALQTEFDALHQQYLRELDNIRSSVGNLAKSEARSASRLQAEFYGEIQRNRTAVTIFLVNGVKYQGVISGFDGDNLLLNRDGHTQLIYIDAISICVPGLPFDLRDPASASSDN